MYVKVLIVQITIIDKHWSNKLSFSMVIKYTTWNSGMYISSDIGTDFWTLHICLDVAIKQNKTKQEYADHGKSLSFN